jgi:hypothetical protein
VRRGSYNANRVRRKCKDKKKQQLQAWKCQGLGLGECGRCSWEGTAPALSQAGGRTVG